MRRAPDAGRDERAAAPAALGRGSALGALRVRLRVWTHALALDRLLAEGTRPACAPELELRARQLTALRSRRALAGYLTATVDAAGRPWRVGGPAAPIARRDVLEAAGPLIALARDLTAAHDPPVRAVALASWLVCDGASSPMYDPGSPVTVREVAERARAALGEHTFGYADTAGIPPA